MYYGIIWRQIENIDVFRMEIKMENSYQEIRYSNDEKVMTYVKAIIKAVDMTHEVASKSKMKSKKAKEAIQSGDKALMWSTLQQYIYHYKDFINRTEGMCVYKVDVEFYNQITVAEIKQQLEIMIGIVYDYEAKHCLAKETIKQCLKKLLEESGMFTKKEIEYLLS